MGALFRAAGLALLVWVMALPAARANEEDVGFLARTLQSYLSDAGREVRIIGFQGALSSRATIRSLTIADDEGVWITLTGLVLDWDRSALFSRRIDINELTAERIEIARIPGGAEAGTDLPSPTARPAFSLPELPVSIRVGTVRAERIVLGAPILGEPAEVRLEGTAQLEGGEGTTRFEARRVDGAEGHFIIAGGFNNLSRQLELQIELAEGPDGIAANLLGIPGRPSVELVARGSDPIQSFRADLSLSTDGQQRVAGTATFIDTSPEGSALDGAVVRLDVGGDLRPLLAPDLHPFFGPETRLVAEGARDEDGALRLSDLRAQTQSLIMTGRAELSPDGLPTLIDLSLDLSDPQGAPVVLPGTDGQGQVQSADLVVSFDATQGPDWSVAGRLNGLNLPQIAVGQVVLDARGLLGTVAATAGAPVFDGTFEFAATGLAAADPALQQALGDEVYGLLSLTAPGGGEPLQFTGISLEARTLSLTGQGVLNGLTFDGFVEAEAPALAPFSGLAGRTLGGAALISLRGQVNPLTGALDANANLTTTDLSIGIPEADNLLAGRAGIEVSVRRDTEGTVLRALTVQAGTLGLSAQGTVGTGTADLTARLRLSDLGRLGGGYRGALGLDVELTQTEGLLRATLGGEITDLAVGDLPGAAQIAALFQGRTTLNGAIAQQDGALRIESLSMDGPRLALSVNGTLSETAQAIALRLDRLILSAVAPGVQGTLTGRADLSGGTEGRRILAEVSSQGAIRSGIAALDPFLTGGLRLSADLTERQGALRLDDLRLNATGIDLRAQGRAEPDGALSVTLDGGIDTLTRLQSRLEGGARIAGRLSRAAGATDIAADLTLTGPSQLALTARGTIQTEPDLRLALSLSGGVEAGLANPFIAPATVQGTVQVNGSVNGPPALSSLRLTAQASGGRYVLPGAGVAFSGISATADLAGGAARINLRGESSRGGTVSAEGTLTLLPALAVDMTATANSLRIAQARLFEGAVSGTVRVAGSLVTGPTASGRVTIDEAEIRIPNSPLSRTGFVPSGLRHVGEAAASRATRLNAGVAETQVADRAAPRLPLYLDLTLDAPGRIFVRGRGLDAELGGSLRLSGTTIDTIPSGAFTLIRGRLDLLGNRFTLTDGSASLLGSFVPVVRLVATTESGGVVTSVVLQGPVDSPEIRFESVPELPQDEVLARLLFGRGLSTLSPFQAAQLGLSVATLTGRAESSFIDRTRRALGLDDLDFTTDAQGATSLRAGRYLTERVYTDLSVSSQGRSELRIQLDITPSLTLRGRADSEGRSGVGVFFERDY